MAPFRSRAPLDVDLEDKLIFGLSPVRFGYLAVGALAAYVLGAHTSLPGALRVPAALLLLSAAAAVAWVRWRGRPLDAWLLDGAIFARRNFEVQVDPALLWRIRAPLRRRRAPRIPTITVLADRPGAGATTVAVELGAALALKGRRVAMTQAARGGDASSRLGLAGSGTHTRTGLALVESAVDGRSDCLVVDLGDRGAHRRADLALVVAAPDDSTGVAAVRKRVPGAGHIAVVVNRDREADRAAEPGGLPVAAVVPDDPAVPAAQLQREPVILQFPGSPAARALRLLADQVDPGSPAPWHHSDSDRPRAG